jgi:hypothetical protein
MPQFQGFVEEDRGLVAKVHYPDARLFRLNPAGGAEIVPNPNTKLLSLQEITAAHAKLADDNPVRGFYQTIMNEMGRRAELDGPQVIAPSIKPPTLSM